MKHVDAVAELATGGALAGNDPDAAFDQSLFDHIQATLRAPSGRFRCEIPHRKPRTAQERFYFKLDRQLEIDGAERRQALNVVTPLQLQASAFRSLKQEMARMKTCAPEEARDIARLIHRNVAMCNYYGLAYRLAAGHMRLEIGYAAQEAFLKLLVAFDHYRPDHGVSFGAFAAPAIRNRLADLLDYEHRRLHPSLNQPVTVGEEVDAIEWGEILTEDPDTGRIGTVDGNREANRELLELRRRYDIIVDALPPRVQEILDLRTDGYDHKEIAAILGLSPAAARKAYERAQKLFREALARIEGFGGE